MPEQRKDTRYETLVKVQIEGKDDIETYLKDISVTGCRVECKAFPNIEYNAMYKLKITPENTPHTEAFVLEVIPRWVRAGNYSCEIGFFIMEFPKGKQFQSYVDFLAWRYAHGKSMTGDGSMNSPEL